ncbi:hypothetical protein G9A89_012294 [Geosiphon pyriformis]|nr:hypothetical protein G9A89_012294 [Geosiphon pyriformis]
MLPDQVTTKNWLKSKLQTLKKVSIPHFSEDVFLSILLCLISGEKHLILTTKKEDLDELRLMTEQVILNIFGLFCSTITCNPTQTPAEFYSSFFPRPKEETSQTTSNTPMYGHPFLTNNLLDESANLLKSQKSVRSIKTASSTNSHDVKLQNYEPKIPKRRSNYSYVSTFSEFSTKETIFSDRFVMEEPQDQIDFPMEEASSSNIDHGEFDGSEKLKDRSKTFDNMEKQRTFDNKETHSTSFRPPSSHYQARRRNTVFSSTSSTGPTASPIEIPSRPNLSILTGSPRRNNFHPHFAYSPFSVTPLDFKVPKKRHENQSMGGQDPPSPFIGSRKLANAVIIEGLTDANEVIHAYLLEILIRKQAVDRHIPRPFIVIALLPQSNGRHNLPSQLLDHFFISYTYETTTGNIGGGKSSLSVNRKNSLVRNSELEDLSQRIDKVMVHNDMQRYMRDVIVGVRTHRSVKGGITARTSSDLVTLVKALATVYQKNFVTPELVLIASEKVLSHRLLLREAGDDHSTMYGTSPLALLKTRSHPFTTLCPGDVIADVLQIVRPPI